MEEPKPCLDRKTGATGLKRIINAFGFSMDGFGSALKHESAFRQESFLAVVLIPLSFFVPVGWGFRALMIASVLLILIVELLNSAVEAAIDYISRETHPLAKRAKDLGSAAVFLSLLSCGIVWACALWTWLRPSSSEKILNLLNR